MSAALRGTRLARAVRREPPPRLAHLAVVATLAGGCEADEGTAPACGAGHDCEIPSTRAELVAALDGFVDPVAMWLRGAVDDDARLPGDHEDALAGVRGVLGCTEEREHSFVVLSNAAFAPKALVTQCTDAPIDASQVFTVFEPADDGGDLDATRFRMAAWDRQAAKFHRYQFVPRDGGLAVSVEPSFCVSCHGGPYALPDWSPIMNEMTNPWAMWNAEPGFDSLQFTENFPNDAGGDVYAGLAAAGRLDSASNLEPVIRAAIDRVVAARLAARAGDPDLAAAAALLRPVFCDESANYVSEIHDSGELAQSAVLDPGIRRMLLAIDPTGWPWSFLQDEAVYLVPPQDGEAPLVLMGVRGETTVQMEAALVTRLVLEPIDVLRVRALDWRHPTLSDLRCGLFEDGLARAEAGAIDVAALEDTAAVVRALHAEALRVGGKSLADVGADAIVALADANDTASVDEIIAGDFSAATTTLAQLGDAIEAELATVAEPGARARLDDERIRRGCILRDRDATAPLIPNTDNCPRQGVP